MTKKKVRLGVGVPTAIFIILTLTLILFAALSFLEGRGDLSLTERAVQMAQDYYGAIRESEERLMALDRALKRENALTEALVQNLGGDMRDADTCAFSFDAGGGRTLTLVIGGLKERAPKVLARRLTAQGEEEEQEPPALYLG